MSYLLEQGWFQKAVQGIEGMYNTEHTLNFELLGVKFPEEDLLTNRQKVLLGM